MGILRIVLSYLQKRIGQHKLLQARNRVENHLPAVVHLRNSKSYRNKESFPTDESGVPRESFRMTTTVKRRFGCGP
jgi:hypothetical protein